MPGQTVSWEIGVGVPPTSAGDLVNPKITDCLPPGLDLLDPINPANPINGTATGFSVLPVISALRQRLRHQPGPDHLDLAGPFTLAKGQSGTFTLNTLVRRDAPPASVQTWPT